MCWLWKSLWQLPGCQAGIHTCNNFKVPTQAKTTRGQREHLQSWLSDKSRFNSSIWMVWDWKSYIRLSCELRIFEGLSIEPSRVYEYYSKLHDISKKSWESLVTKESQANRWETPKHQESGWRLWSALQKAGWTELVLIGQTLLDTVSTT